MTRSVALPPLLDESVLAPEVLAKGIALGARDPALLMQVLEVAHRRYEHWDTLRFKAWPGSLDPKVAWVAIKLARRHLAQPAPMVGKQGEAFTYGLTPALQRDLHEITRAASGTLASGPDGTGEEHDRYVISSLMEEAIASSQIEGANTTRRVAKDMLRSGRAPRTHSEQMILNNYQALQELMRRLDEDLSESLLTTLHATLTRGTLRSPEAEGRLRTTDDIVVQDGVTGEIVHVPPSHRVIRERLERLYRFANGTSTNEFVDPVVKASMLHYWLAYEHPFEDGNGRTARMLLYWSLLRDGYWLVELLSISQQIKRAATQYYRAFEHVATDEFDLTYFIANDIRAIRKALDAWRKYFETRRAEMRELQDRLQAMHGLNHRQRTLVAHALRHPSNVYTVQSHARSQQVADPTARSDLKELVDRGYLRILRSGRPVEYAPVPDLEARLRGSGRRTRRTAASRRRNPGGR